MDGKHFQWQPVLAPDKKSEEPAPPPALAGWARFKPYVPIALFAVLLVTLFVTRKPESAAARDLDTASSVDVLVPLVPIPRGGMIELGALRQIPLRAKDLTARQRLQAVRHDDLQKLQGQVRAKKTLAPQQILYWSELEIHTGGGSPGAGRTRIYMPQDDGSAR